MESRRLPPRDHHFISCWKALIFSWGVDSNYSHKYPSELLHPVGLSFLPPSHIPLSLLLYPLLFSLLRNLNEASDGQRHRGFVYVKVTAMFLGAAGFPDSFRRVP